MKTLIPPGAIGKTQDGRWKTGDYFRWCNGQSYQFLARDADGLHVRGKDGITIIFSSTYGWREPNERTNILTADQKLLFWAVAIVIFMVILGSLINPGPTYKSYDERVHEEYKVLEQQDKANEAWLAIQIQKGIEEERVRRAKRIKQGIDDE